MSRTRKGSLTFTTFARFTNEPGPNYGTPRSPGSPVNLLMSPFARFARFTKAQSERIASIIIASQKVICKMPYFIYVTPLSISDAKLIDYLQCASRAFP